MHKTSNRAHLLIFGLALAIAAFIRFRVAPLSAGPDVAQFWAFAETFRQHGLDFYRYADADSAFFPFRNWGYVYPPIWILVLGLAILATPLSTASSTMVDPMWRLAAKTPMILADLGIGCLLYWAIPGSKYWKLLIACLWLFNPTAWYNSAVFGQFDAIAACLLLASVIILERGHDRWAFVLAALAGLTKQHALLPVIVLIAALAGQAPRRRVLSNVALLAGVMIAFSIPFLATGNFKEYFQSVVLPGQSPGYQTPLMYAFTGPAALLTYLNTAFGWDTSGYFVYFIPVLLLSFVAIAVTAYLRRISVIRGALIGILLFVTLFYRINYQYLIIMIPLALLVASLTTYKSEKALALALALFPAGWLWMFTVSFWFTYLLPKTDWIVPILGKVGLTRGNLPDYAYTAFAMAITALCITYIVLAFVHWNRPLKSLQPEKSAKALPQAIQTASPSITGPAEKSRQYD